MEDNILNAIERTKQSGKFREKGFVAGVLYGDSAVAGNPVKFDAATLLKVIKSHGSKAKVSIMFNNSKKLGFIREVQRDPISQQVTHVDIQILAKDQALKMLVPVIYKGEENLAERELQLQKYKSEIALSGKMDLMPESITVDISDMQAGDSITVTQLNLDQRLKVGDKEDIVYAVIINQSVVPSAPSPPVEEE